MGENPSDSVEIDVSHDAAVNSMTIDNPSNCVALVSNLRLQDEDCSTAVYPHICTISYNAVSGLGASIGKILISYFNNTEEIRLEDSRYSHIFKLADLMRSIKTNGASKNRDS